MSLFRRKHKTTICRAGFGQWDFVCSCGKPPSRQPLWTAEEAEAKALQHRESQARR